MSSFWRSIALVPALLVVPALVQAADHSLTLEVGTGYYLPSQQPASRGFGNFVAIDVPVAFLEVGYYFEYLNVKLKSNDDITATSPDATTVDVWVAINEIRVAVPLADNLIRVGVGLGMTDIKGVCANNTPGNSFTTTAPVTEIFACVQPLRGGDKVRAAINVLVGYRLILTDELDPDGAAGASPVGTDYASDGLKNLNGFRLGLSATLSF